MDSWVYTRLEIPQFNWFSKCNLKSWGNPKKINLNLVWRYFISAFVIHRTKYNSRQTPHFPRPSEHNVNVLNQILFTKQAHKLLYANYFWIFQFYTPFSLPPFALEYLTSWKKISKKRFFKEPTWIPLSLISCSCHKKSKRRRCT